MPAEINGRDMTSSTSSGSLDDVRRPSSLRIIICRASTSRSCSFSPVSAATVSALVPSNRVSRSVPAPIYGNGLESQIDRGEMSSGGNAALTQDRGCEQPPEPGCMLEHREISFQASSATIA